LPIGGGSEGDHADETDGKAQALAKQAQGEFAICRHEISSPVTR
jgi:hypothetical protein